MEELTSVEFNELVYTASKSLKVPALRFTNNLNDANDLIQDTILKALDNQSKFKTGTNIKAWLYIIMKNTFITNYHADKKSSVLDPLEDDYAVSAISTTSYNLGSTALFSKEIAKAISNLDKNLKVPFMMHYEGFKYSEIAEQLNVPLGTVKNRIHLARKVLMDNLKDYQ